MRRVSIVLIFLSTGIALYSLIGSVNLLRTKRIIDEVKSTGELYEVIVATKNQSNSSLEIELILNDTIVWMSALDSDYPFSIGDTIEVFHNSDYPTRWVYPRDEIQYYQFWYSLSIPIVLAIPLIILIISRRKKKINSR